MESPLSKNKISIRGRIIMGLGTFWCLAVTYMHRQNINVVIAQIVSINAPEKNIYEWTKSQKGVVLMSFYAGYCLTQILGGVSAEKYGPKITLLVSILVSSAATFATPAAFDASLYVLVFIRILTGAAQGLFFPAFLIVAANWFPPEYRVSAIGLMYPGTYFGTILSLFLASGLAKNVALWRISFYILGIIGIIWIILWIIFASDNPENHRWSKNDEKSFLASNVERNQVTNIKKIPLMEMVKSVPLIALMICHFSIAWSLFLLVTIAPSMIKDLYYVSVKNQTYITFTIPLVTWIGGSISCMMCDFFHKKYSISTLRLRKTAAFFALLPVSIFLLFATLIHPNKYYYGVFLIILSCFFSGTFVSVSMGNIGDIAPQYYGIISGANNTLGAISGLIAIQTSYQFVSDNHNPREWQNVFFLMLAIHIVGVTVYLFYAEATIQKWAIQKPEDTQISEL